MTNGRVKRNVEQKIPRVRSTHSLQAHDSLKRGIEDPPFRFASNLENTSRKLNSGFRDKSSN